MPGLLITGASGQLGAYLLRHLADEEGLVAAWSGSRSGELFGRPLHPVDMADPLMIWRSFEQIKPGVVLHAAALARLSDCHRDPERARQVNTAATALLAAACAAHSARLVYVSTDLVFDGTRAPYREGDEPAPLSVYGRTKREAERVVLEGRGNLVVRVSLLVGPSLTGRPSFFDEQVSALREGRAVTLFSDEWRTPLDLPTAARALLELARSDMQGVLHLGGPERLSRLEMGQTLARHLGVGEGAIVAKRRDEVPGAEPRPADTALDSARWRALFPQAPWPTYAQALAQMLPPP